jgi:hypothetical protein
MTSTTRSLALVVAMLSAGSVSADPIMLRVGNFDPAQGVLPLSRNLRAKDTSAAAYYIVQFKSIIQESDKAELRRRNLEALGYLPENAYILRLDGAVKDELAKWNRVAWVGRFEPGYKLSPDLGKRSYTSENRKKMGARGVLQFGVTLHDGADPAEAVHAAENAGLEVIEVSNMGPRWGILMQGKLAAAQALAQVETVAFIEEAADVTLRNDVTAWVAQTNQSGNTSIWNHGLHGENMIVGHMDSAPNLNHDMFRDPSNNTPGPNHRKVVFASASGASSHGTHTAGTLCGDSEPITGSTFRNGHAYKARFAYSPIPSSTGLYTALMTHYNVGARSHSNSWGDDGTTLIPSGVSRSINIPGTGRTPPWFSPRQTPARSRLPRMRRMSSRLAIASSSQTRTIPAPAASVRRSMDGGSLRSGRPAQASFPPLRRIRAATSL